MTRYLMYKNKINNMGDKRLPKIVSYFGKKHMQLKQGWHKYATSWINHRDSRKNSLYKILIILKVLLHLNLWRSCGAINNSTLI